MGLACGPDSLHMLTHLPHRKHIAFWGVPLSAWTAHHHLLLQSERLCLLLPLQL